MDQIGWQSRVNVVGEYYQLVCSGKPWALCTISEIGCHLRGSLWHVCQSLTHPMDEGLKCKAAKIIAWFHDKCVHCSGTYPLDLMKPCAGDTNGRWRDLHVCVWRWARWIKWIPQSIRYFLVRVVCILFWLYSNFHTILGRLTTVVLFRLLRRISLWKTWELSLKMDRKINTTTLESQMAPYSQYSTLIFTRSQNSPLCRQ